MDFSNLDFMMTPAEALSSDFDFKVPEVDTAVEPTAAENSPKNALHSCKECDKTFKYVSSLKEHQRRHTGEMPYKCPHPGCTFRGRWRSSLYNHRRYHNDAPAKATAKPKRADRRHAVRTTPEAQMVPICAPVKMEYAKVESVLEGDIMEAVEDLWAGEQLDFPFETEPSELSDTQSEIFNGLAF